MLSFSGDEGSSLNPANSLTVFCTTPTFRNDELLDLNPLLWKNPTSHDLIEFLVNDFLFSTSSSPPTVSNERHRFVCCNIVSSCGLFNEPWRNSNGHFGSSIAIEPLQLLFRCLDEIFLLSLGSKFVSSLTIIDTPQSNDRELNFSILVCTFGSCRFRNWLGKRSNDLLSRKLLFGSRSDGNSSCDLSELRIWRGRTMANGFRFSSNWSKSDWQRTLFDPLFKYSGERSSFLWLGRGEPFCACNDPWRLYVLSASGRGTLDCLRLPVPPPPTPPPNRKYCLIANDQMVKF